MKKLVLSVIVNSILLFTYTVSAQAQGVCTAIYGGGVTCPQVGDVRVNKMIVNPRSGMLSDSLAIDTAFGPDSQVTFQITVTNVGNTTIPRLTIKDIFPQFVAFNAGPGNFDQNTKILSFDTDNLAPNESRNFTITGKTVPANQLPSDQNVVCVVNQTTATRDNQVSQDSAQLCLQKQAPTQPGQAGGVVVTPQGKTSIAQAPGAQTQGATKGGLKIFPQPQMATTPSTGPEMIPLIGLIPSGLLGAFLRKKALKQ